MTDKKNISLHSTLSAKLIDYIQHKGYVHQQMPSERDICQTYQVSRTTVRRALQELEVLGYIYKQHGKGTYISDHWKTKQDVFEGFSFTEYMTSIGKTPKSIVTDFNIEHPNSFIAHQLGLSETDFVFCFSRIRLADDIPMLFETTYLPHALFSTLTLKDIEQIPLYQLLETNFHQSILYADETCQAGYLTEQEAKLLHKEVKENCLRLTRQTVNKQFQLLEYTTSVTHNDLFVYRVRHYKRG
ncbi:UTRA domain-containing protein [Granulicatella sp. zg-ZJ]|uniref:GntR family transcriptional regulator n=1 Tax=unclassified Granulicatella TaxID=2630493 RepID=UPI0013C137CA|nr:MULTISPECIES: GntR family transcriptional regulator [unclassified Granulicatella]MBS4749803.1 GntR family transcriptional regulator [Carnobacteriaceae bacterium zg-ZUI78]NEW61924.1 UTRA domain-containing protein [Granulicatella sp. zg-ZJ]NEW66891.1 UTRA domain-containing protein [Granulicatella sp. zg-84]QMI85902.1 GntR family transcriptional regulator [Carnobacteriaceae bacterium zg-84]